MLEAAAFFWLQHPDSSMLGEARCPARFDQEKKPARASSRPLSVAKTPSDLTNVEKHPTEAGPRVCRACPPVRPKPE
jgi:hypothetical protein